MAVPDRNRFRLVPWVGLALALAALVAVGLLWSAARRDAAGLREWQTAMVRQIARAAAAPGTPVRPVSADDAPETLAGIVAMRDGAVAMTADTAPASVAAPPTAAGDDANTEISRLSQTQSTGSAAGDAQIIERDSRAAWTGWK